MPRTGKAQRTRERLVRTALELFAAEGFDNTSVAQIARAAGVTEMTFYRNFPTKDSVVLDDPFDPIIADAVASQPAASPALTAVAAGIREVWSSVPTTASDSIRGRLQVIGSSPRLRAGMAQSTTATQEAIADGLRSRGTDTTDADIAAAAAIGALNAALMSWAPREHESLDLAIERALAILEANR